MVVAILKCFLGTVFNELQTSEYHCLKLLFSEVVLLIMRWVLSHCCCSNLFGSMVAIAFQSAFHSELYQDQGCQFRSVSPGMAETFHTNSKNETKRNKFHLILNLGPFRIFQLNSTRNVPVSFHMFRSALEKPLNQIEPCSI